LKFDCIPVILIGTINLAVEDKVGEEQGQVTTAEDDVMFFR
jgi:hypothetical protein